VAARRDQLRVRARRTFVAVRTRSIGHRSRRRGVGSHLRRTGVRPPVRPRRRQMGGTTAPAGPKRLQTAPVGSRGVTHSLLLKF
jgi:hypothetical protein